MSYDTPPIGGAKSVKRVAGVRDRVTHFWAESTASVKRTFVDHLPLYFCLVAFTAITLTIAVLYKAPVELGATVFFLELAPSILLSVFLFAR
jgi:hypothetical protein